MLALGTIAAFAMMARILRTAGAAPALVLAATVWLVFLTPLTELQVWWSAGLHGIPAMVFSVACAVVLVERRPPGRKLEKSLPRCCSMLALSFYFKAIAFPGAAVRDRLRRRGWPDAVPPLPARAASHALCGLVVAAAYLVVPLLFTPPLATKPPIADVAQFILLSVADGTIASLFGLGVPGSIFSLAAMA